MKRFLLIGASGGIGRALATEAQARGFEVTGLSRSAHGLDIADERSISQCFAGLTGRYDLIMVATGALTGAGHPPEKTIKSLTPEALVDQFQVNALGPALVLKHTVRLMPKDQRAVFAALSARVGSIGDNRLGGWYSYRAAKSALNQLIHGAAIELARTHPHAVCVSLHPGTVATKFTKDYANRHETVPPQDAARNLLDVTENLQPAQTGGFFDYAGQEIAW